MLLFFLSSGLFLGWSLGANDASNVFGTAVATRMVKFRTAAYVSSIFVILGAVISGAGASHTLGKLGAVNALAGSFMVALAAAFTVYWMTRSGLPVSTSQAIVGAIIGWNFFSGTLTDYSSLTKIVATWVVCPFLAAAFSIVLYKLAKIFLAKAKIHLLQMDFNTRLGLLLVGAFGSFSLGANNIANVMGVFVPVAPFRKLDFFGLFQLSGAQQLFFLGGLAIAVGIFTYSHRVMSTVGNELVKLTPVAALVVVLSESLVLFLFASERLANWLIGHGLPSIPLVPVSSSQAVVGAVMGIGIARGGKGIKFKTFGNIAFGWIATPIAAALFSFFALFFLQNVFNQHVYRPVQYKISKNVINEIHQRGLETTKLEKLLGKKFDNGISFKKALHKEIQADKTLERMLFELAEIDFIRVDENRFKELDNVMFTDSQIAAIHTLAGKKFHYKWQFENALSRLTNDFQKLPDKGANKKYNKMLEEKINYLISIFRVTE